MGTIEDAINGVDVDEDKVVEEMLRAHQPHPPKVEVIQPKPTKLLVNIPANDPHGATVTRVEVQPDGNFRVLEHARAPTSAELVHIKTGRKEVLSGPAEEPSTAPGRPWWHYALGIGIPVAVAGAWYAKKVYWDVPALEEEFPAGDRFEEDEEFDEVDAQD